MPKSDPDSLLIGAHCSGAGGLYNALLQGVEIGANTIQLFTANQKRWQSKPLEEEVVRQWHETLEKTGIQQVMSHDSYLINLGAPNPEVLAKSRKGLREELERCHTLDITYLNFHPGAALKEPRELCLDKIIESLLELEALAAEGSTRLLLETTAGQGSTVGCTFEELGYILRGVGDRLPIGVCIDTCHIFAAGYDIRTAEACEETLRQYEEHCGIESLYAFHLNDSLKELGSRVDRHRPLGEGEIGLECFKFLMNDPRTRELPKYLETPGGTETWSREIPMLRAMAK